MPNCRLEWYYKRVKELREGNINVVVMRNKGGETKTCEGEVSDYPSGGRCEDGRMCLIERCRDSLVGMALNQLNYSTMLRLGYTP